MSTYSMVKVRTKPRLRARSGFTIIEMLVVISIIAILLGLLLPAIGRARDTALQTTSLSNLRQLSAGLAAYAGDWADRQPTLIPDDFCQSGGSIGNPTWYTDNIGCIPQPILGWANVDGQRGLYGYWINLGNSRTCIDHEGPGSTSDYADNFKVALPYSCDLQIGFFRQPNLKIFSQYMNNKYYDPVFYAPKDRRKLDRVEKFFEQPHEFSFDDPAAGGDGAVEWSSYCFAASAMFNPRIWDPVKNNNGNGTVNDNASAPCNGNGGGPSGLKSPPVGQATYPDLKTRILEHEWLQNAPGDTNPLFSGGREPYYFNHGIRSAPCTLFFDGSVRLMGVQEAVKSNERVTSPLNSSGESLWCRDWCDKDYFERQSYGFELEESSYHILTRLGIKGRDTIGEE